ncbi:hypothetical protein D6S19_23145 [Salmonella enterica subsp. enterica serovar Reading]|nr:hypothetical protein [Salmonella enterica]EBY8607843.1 hypothetical protein [Salmonella enterica subsp. enterica serovar Reading]
MSIYKFDHYKQNCREINSGETETGGNYPDNKNNDDNQLYFMMDVVTDNRNTLKKKTVKT